MPALSLALAVLSAILAASVTIYFGNRKPGYSHLRHTISELGEMGSPVGKAVSHFGFVTIGAVLWLFVMVAAKAVPHQWDVFLMLSLVGAAYVGGGIFRCDPDAPLIGSWSTTLHNILGAFGYLGAAAAFATLKHDAFWSPLSDVISYGGPIVRFCLAGIG